jgi:hypothetical protein
MRGAWGSWEPAPTMPAGCDGFKSQNSGSLPDAYAIGAHDVSRTLRFTVPTLAPRFDFGEDICGGVFVCTCTVNWRRTTDGLTGTTGLGKAEWGILGDNPTKASIRAAIGDTQLCVIAYKESRFRQFDNTGLSLFGPPNGFGVMQLDNPIRPTSQQLWNWRLNVFGGVGLYNKKRLEVTQHFNNIYVQHPEAPHLTAEQSKLALYQYYNGGWYWAWQSSKKSWQKFGPTSYGDDCLCTEKAVAAGRPPVDWN